MKVRTTLQREIALIFVLALLTTVLAACGKETEKTESATQRAERIMLGCSVYVRYLADEDETSYYAVKITDDMLSLLAMDSWEPSESSETEKSVKIAVIRLAEKYEIALYSNGMAMIYDYYSELYGEAETWYKTSFDLNEIIDYLEEYSDSKYTEDEYAQEINISFVY